MDTPNNEQIEIVTLKDFLDDNQKSIAVVGVFAALGLIWKSTVATGQNVPLVAYLCFFITVPILWEVRSRYPGHIAHWRLTWFMDWFTAIFFLSFLSVLISWPEHLGLTITAVLGFVILTFGFKFLAQAEARAKAKKRTKYLDDWNAVNEDDPERSIKLTSLNAEYLKFNWKEEVRTVVPVLVLVLVVLSSWLFLSNLLQAIIDVDIRRLKMFEIPPL